MPRKRNKPDLLPGTLDMLVLKTLTTGPLHGYAIVRRIQERSKDVLQVEEGSLYPALHRMHKQGWIEAEWGVSETNRRAKYYSLTKAGRKQFKEEVAEWEVLSSAVAQVLRTAEGGLA